MAEALTNIPDSSVHIGISPAGLQQTSRINQFLRQRLGAQVSKKGCGTENETVRSTVRKEPDLSCAFHMIPD
jgi:hypothetical protein